MCRSRDALFRQVSQANKTKKQIKDRKARDSKALRNISKRIEMSIESLTILTDLDTRALLPESVYDALEELNKLQVNNQ